MSDLSTAGSFGSLAANPTALGGAGLGLGVASNLIGGKSGGGGYEPRYRMGPDNTYQWSSNFGKSWSNVPQGWATAASNNGRDAAMMRINAMSPTMTPIGYQNPNVYNPFVVSQGIDSITRPLPDVQAANHMDSNIRGFQGFLGNHPNGTYAANALQSSGIGALLPAQASGGLFSQPTGVNLSQPSGLSPLVRTGR